MNQVVDPFRFTEAALVSVSIPLQANRSNHCEKRVLDGLVES